jgi:EmrB/QacA subfamily drug resistance transporter
MTATTAAPGTAPATPGRHTRHATLALLVIASAQLMVVLDATIVNIALPRIHSALQFSETNLAWVLNAYTMTFGGLLLLGGRAGDLFGRRRMFVLGVGIFAVASLLGGFAQDQAWLLATRALQGVGGAIASPTALALIATNFDEGPERNRAMGIYAAVSGAGAAIGLILGGVLTSELTWRWVLFVNAPIGAAIILAAPFVINESEKVRHDTLDLFGAVSSTAGMAALVYGFIRAATPSVGWANPWTLASFAAAAVLLAAFVIDQWRTREPLMPLRLFRDQTRVGSYVVMLILGAAVFAMFYFLTQYVQMVKGYSALKAGFAFLPVSAVIVVIAQLTSRLISRVPVKLLIASGSLFAGGGLLWLSKLTVTSSYLGHVLPAVVLIAVGMGLIFVPITITAVAGVEARDSGVASAMLNVGQQIGGTIGLSALVTVFSHAAASDAVAHMRSLPPALVKAHAFTAGSDHAFAVGAIFALVGFVAALLLVKASPEDLAGAAPAHAGI